MKKSILLALVMFDFYSCQNMETQKEGDNQDASHEAEGLKFADIFGDTLRYEVGEAVLDTTR